MRAGKLREPLTFQEPVDISNNKGGFIRSWEEYKKMMGAVITLQGREFIEAQQRNSEIEKRIEIRWDPNIEKMAWDNKLRIKYRGGILRAKWALDPDEMQVELHLYCIKEGLNNGV